MNAKPTLISIAVVIIIIQGLSHLDRATQPTLFAPESAESDRIVFFVLGDQGTGSYRQHAVAWFLERACQQDGSVNFSLLLGDNFYMNGVASVNDPLWDRYFESVYDGPCLMGMPFFAMLGNHDYLGNAQAQVEYTSQGIGSGRWRMPATSYSQDFGRVAGRVLLRLFVVDTQMPLTPQLSTIKKQVGNNPGIWNVVAGHHTIRSFDVKYGTNEDLLDFADELNNLGIDLYLSGHAHTLQLVSAPSEPLYVISGAGGKRPYAIVDNPTSMSRYARDSLGFASISVDQKSLEISYYPVGFSEPSTFRVDRQCRDAGNIADCIAAVQ